MQKFDPEILKQKIEQLRNPKAFKSQQRDEKSSRIWRPKQDEPNLVRLIRYPFAEDVQDAAQQRFFHYGVAGKYTVMCLYKNKLGDCCPVCELATQLWNSKDPQDKELAKKMFASDRYISLLIDRADPKFIPKFYVHSKKIYDKILTYLCKPDFSEFFDELTGLDMEITSTKSERSMFAIPDFSFARKESRLAKTDIEIKEILNNIPKIEDVFKPMSEVEIRKIVDKWLDVSEDPKGKTIQGKKQGEEKDELKDDMQKIDKIFDNNDEQSLEQAFDSIK